ncbi:MAG: hypothetical protein QME87_10285 [Bacillota bacterium]|nr:hypothetical protein [Bacillota bacterium]
MEAILRVLPPRAVPLVSRSGKKGWHLWLFPAEPLPVDVAVTFAAEVRRLAGVPCEAFPTSRNSRCLKWPGSLHPETGVQEAFVDIRTGGVTELDTQAVLEMLAAGMLRTPARVFYQVAASSPLAPPVLTGRFPDRPAPKKANAQAGAQAPARNLSLLDSLARSEKLAAWLLQEAGRKPVPIGKAFRCILPGHQERKASASFYRMEDGHIMYRDWHGRNGQEWYTMGEVYAALRTGHARKLRSHEAATWLAKAGIAAELVPHSTFSTIDSANSVFEGWVGAARRQNPPVIFQVGLTANAGPQTLKVWEVFVKWARLTQVCGFSDVFASKRFVAEQAGIPPWVANRCMNLLAVLGFLEKLPSTGGGDRWRVLAPNLEDVLKQWEALGRPSLREFGCKLVADRLGEDVAARVFRR